MHSFKKLIINGAVKSVCLLEKILLQNFIYTFFGHSIETSPCTLAISFMASIRIFGGKKGLKHHAGSLKLNESLGWKRKLWKSPPDDAWERRLCDECECRHCVKLADTDGWVSPDPWRHAWEADENWAKVRRDIVCYFGASRTHQFEGNIALTTFMLIASLSKLAAGLLIVMLCLFLFDMDITNTLTLS